jgi:hypothetical protein
MQGSDRGRLTAHDTHIVSIVIIGVSSLLRGSGFGSISEIFYQPPPYTQTLLPRDINLHGDLPRYWFPQHNRLY